jgi:hypothetical protein
MLCLELGFPPLMASLFIPYSPILNWRVWTTEARLHRQLDSQCTSTLSSEASNYTDILQISERGCGTTIFYHWLSHPHNVDSYDSSRSTSPILPKSYSGHGIWTSNSRMTYLSVLTFFLYARFRLVLQSQSRSYQCGVPSRLAQIPLIYPRGPTMLVRLLVLL